MNLSVLEKIKLIVSNLFSSFLGIDIFLISLLLFAFLFFNLKRNNKIVSYLFITIVSLFLFVMIGLNMDYVVYCIDTVIKKIMNYIYFPSTVIYFVIILICTINIIYSIVSKRDKFLKIVDMSMFSLIYLLFFNFIALVIDNKLNISDKITLYENGTILSVVQASNILFVIWIIITIFDKLYHYFQKFDEKKEDVI